MALLTERSLPTQMPQIQRLAFSFKLYLLLTVHRKDENKEMDSGIGSIYLSPNGEH